MDCRTSASQLFIFILQHHHCFQIFKSGHKYFKLFSFSKQFSFFPCLRLFSTHFGFQAAENWVPFYKSFLVSLWNIEIQLNPANSNTWESGNGKWFELPGIWGLSRLCSATFEQLLVFGATFCSSSNQVKFLPFRSITYLVHWSSTK